MPGFGSNSSALTFAKGSRRDDKAARAAKHAQASEIEDRKVKRRSGGRCEMRIVAWVARAIRCRRRAVHIHHRLGGHGRRDVGSSMLAENKLHLCALCHEDERTKQVRPVSVDDGGDWGNTVIWERA